MADHGTDPTIRSASCGPLHQAVGRGEIRGREIGWPGLRIAPRQLLLDVRDRRVRFDALTNEDIHGIGAQAAVRQTACWRRREPHEPGVQRRQDFRRNTLASFFCFHQHVRGVDARELSGHRRGRPQAEAALIVLAAAKHRECGLERLRVAASDRAELRPSGQHEASHAFAHQLLGAGVVVVIEIGRSPCPHTSGRAEIAASTVRRSVYMSRVRGTTALAPPHDSERQLRPVRNRRTHADALFVLCLARRRGWRRRSTRHCRGPGWPGCGTRRRLRVCRGSRDRRRRIRRWTDRRSASASTRMDPFPRSCC